MNFRKRETLLTVHQPLPNGLGVGDLLEEASVILDSLDAESVVLGSDSVHEVIVRDLVSINSSLDGRVVCSNPRRVESVSIRSPVVAEGGKHTDKANSLLGRVNLGDLSFVDLDLALQVTGEEASGLDDGASGEGADGDGGKEWGEEEVVARRDDDLLHRAGSAGSRRIGQLIR